MCDLSKEPFLGHFVCRGLFAELLQSSVHSLLLSELRDARGSSGRASLAPGASLCHLQGTEGHEQLLCSLCVPQGALWGLLSPVPWPDTLQAAASSFQQHIQLCTAQGWFCCCMSPERGLEGSWIGLGNTAVLWKDPDS